MDKESDESPQPVVPPSRRTVRMEPWERMSTGSPAVSLPNPYASNPRNNHFTSPRRKPAPPDTERDRRGGGPGRNGPSNKHNDRRSTEEGSRLYTDKSRWDPQTKKSKHISDSQSQDRTFGDRSQDGAKKALRGPRSAPSGARSPTGPPQAGRVSFQVKMADFPELAVAASGTSAAPGQTRAPSWGPQPQSQGPQTQGPLSSNKASTIAERSRESPRTRLHNRDVKSVSSSRSPDGETLFTVDSGKAKVSSAGLERPASAASSWANVASQPPRKPAPDHSAQEDAAAAERDDKKKQRKRKKKKARGSEDEHEDPQVLQEPPKFEDEDEFPDLGRASVGPSRLTSSSTTAQLCNEECPKDVFRPQQSEQRKDNTPAGKTVAMEPTKKGQKGEKATGKKSKVPLQLDIGTMLEVLEKKHQSQKSKHDAKPLILSVGGALPVGLKQPAVQKKGAWQQDKIAHNPLDSTSPMVKKGKQREVPKAKKPTQLKRVILKEREERKQTRLLQERGLDPQQESRPEEPPAGQHDETGATDDVISPSLPEEDQPAVGERQVVDMEADGGREEEEEEEEEQHEQQDEKRQQQQQQQEEEQEEQPEEQQNVEPLSQPIPNNRPKIHSRKFRDYCSQVLSKDVDECVSALLRELVRFQDRLYQKDPMKARMKKRLVMGLREVLKHLRLGKVKCVVISPNCERSQSKGGLDEALHTIIDTCREQGVPFVFALSRKALGRCVNKAVPVSLVGIFNYDGAQDFYHKMIELSSEARKAYEEMLERVEMMEQTEEVEVVVVEEENQGQQRVRPGAPTPPPPPQEEGEEPDYIKVWKKMLEKDCNHQFLSFEEHLTSLRLDSEDQTETSDADQQS